MWFNIVKVKGRLSERRGTTAGFHNSRQSESVTGETPWNLHLVSQDNLLGRLGDGSQRAAPPVGFAGLICGSSASDLSKAKPRG